jgi:hypothetical protein
MEAGSGKKGVVELINAQFFFKIAAGLYVLSFAVGFASARRPGMVWLFLLPALLANAAAVGLRYRMAWPMLPMYLGPVALPFFLGFLLLFHSRQQGDGVIVRQIILALTAIIALAAACFPKDFYLPFLKSCTLLAHLFLVFGIVGKGCFLVGTAWAMAGLNPGHRTSGTESQPALNRSLRWTVWGFSFWTLSMFAGEFWSYLGWGTPVVWEDPAITTAMATWFFYICLLHLHLTGSWTARGRGAYGAAGALVILGLNCVPELGPFRWPF